MISARSPFHLFALVLLSLLPLGPSASAAVTTVGNATAFPNFVNIGGFSPIGITVHVSGRSKLVAFGGIFGGGGTNVRFGLYLPDNSIGAPGTLVAQSGLVATAAGSVEAAPTAPIELESGDYWLMVTYDGNTSVSADTSVSNAERHAHGRVAVDPTGPFAAYFPGPPSNLFYEFKFNYYLKLAAAPAPTLAKPATNAVFKTLVAVDYTLPEVAQAGSVQLIFDDGTPHALTLAGESATQYSFTFDPKKPLTTSAGAITGGAAVPDGVYTVTLHYLDPTDSGPGIAVATGVTIDTTAPTATVPATITLDADATGRALVGDLTDRVTNVVDAVTAVPSVTQDLAPTTTYTIGSYPIIFTVTDGVGNHADFPSTIKVAFPTISTPATSVSAIADAGTKGALVTDATNLGLAADARYTAFFTPAISDLRDLACRAVIQSGGKKLSGIYRENGAGTGQLVAYAGGLVTPAPATMRWKSILDPLLAADGTLTFGAKVTDVGLKPAEQDGLWSNVFLGAAAAPVRVLQQGHEVGLGANILLKSIISTSVRPGEIICLVNLTGSGVTSKSNKALLRLAVDPNSQNVTTTSLLSTGDQPMALNGGTVLGISAFQPAPFATGQGRTHADKGVAARVKIDTKGDVLALVADDGTFRLLLSGVGVDAGLGVQPKKLLLPAAAGNGVAAKITAAFPPATKAGDAIIFSKTISAFTHALSIGSTIPGGGATFSAFADPVVNDTPGAVFRGIFTAPNLKAPANTALFAWDKTYVVREIIRGGEAATDAAGADLTTTTFKTFRNYALPDGGGVVFLAEVVGKDANGKPFTAASKLGLWCEDGATPGKIRLLLRGGQDVPVPGGTKKLASFRLLDSLPGSFGSRRSYNASKSVVVLATFDDKSQALLRIDLP